MHSKTLVLAALSASVAVAKPHGGKHWHPYGTGHRHHHPTGGWPGAENSTTTVQITSTIYSTVTVQPVAASSTGANLVADSSATPSASECQLTSTRTETSTLYLTVTATGDASSGSSTDATPDATSTSSASSVPSVSAGGFYGQSSYSGYSGYQTPSASATTSSASSGSTYSSTPGSGGSKRGICFNDASMISPFGGSVSWAYNWGSTESGNLDGVEYVPMMWGTNNVNDFASKVGSAKAVLSFNEPDLGAQSNIDPQTAAKQHVAGMQSLVGKVRIGSPAVTNANQTSPPMGQGWLDQFFQACGSSCPVDFIAFHWYSDANNFEYFQNYVDNMSAYAKSKGINSIWLTEFQPQGSDSDQAAFMAKAIPYLESNPTVERYAGFMASDGTMLSGSSLNALGKAYIG